MSPCFKTIARKGYERFRSERCPSWDELTAEKRTTWEKTAQETIAWREHLVAVKDQTVRLPAIHVFPLASPHMPGHRWGHGCQVRYAHRMWEELSDVFFSPPRAVAAFVNRWMGFVEAHGDLAPEELTLSAWLFGQWEGQRDPGSTADLRLDHLLAGRTGEVRGSVLPKWTPEQRDAARRVIEREHKNDWHRALELPDFRILPTEDGEGFYAIFGLGAYDGVLVRGDTPGEAATKFTEKWMELVDRWWRDLNPISLLMYDIFATDSHLNAVADTGVRVWNNAPRPSPLEGTPWGFPLWEERHIADHKYEARVRGLILLDLVLKAQLPGQKD